MYDNLGPLAARFDQWCSCTVHPWVLSTVGNGYRLQLLVKPPSFNGVLSSVADGASAQILEEIWMLLTKYPMRRVLDEEVFQGFYSKYFLISKKEGSSLRPILDLHVLNKHLMKYEDL